MRGAPYPGIVEFRLDGDVFAFFLVLCAEDLELGRFEGTFSQSVRYVARYNLKDE